MTATDGHGPLSTPEPLERGSWPHSLFAASAAVAVLVAVVLRLGFALAPASAAAGNRLP